MFLALTLDVVEAKKLVLRFPAAGATPPILPQHIKPDLSANVPFVLPLPKATTFTPFFPS